jgi:hypothetical protein
MLLADSHSGRFYHGVVNDVALGRLSIWDVISAVRAALGPKVLSRGKVFTAQIGKIRAAREDRAVARSGPVALEASSAWSK